MADIPTGWLTVIMALVAGVVGAIGYLWKEKGAELKALREECADLRRRLETAQGEKLALVQSQLEAVNKRRETDDRIASNLQAVNDILKAKFAA